jgi:hypothetical protein
VFWLVLMTFAASLLFIPKALGSADAAYICANKYMNVRATIVNSANGASVVSDYKVSAYACWDNVDVWAYNSGQPAVTYLSGAGATSYEKGNYLMADGRRDFWVNFHYSVQCSTFPFTVSNRNWYPRIKVTDHGSFLFQAGSSDGNPCYTLTSQILSHN